MSDDTLAALLVLASEKDLMMQLSSDDIIVCLVRSHPSLKSHLLFYSALASFVRSAEPEALNRPTDRL